jgi:uncharacterized protein
MNVVFVDTGYLLALEIANDQHHQAAVQHWQQLVTEIPRLMTTSYVFDEVVTFFNSRGHHAKAVEVGNNLLRSPSVQLIHVDEGLFYEHGHISSSIRTKITRLRIVSPSF